MRVKLGSQYLYISDSTTPKSAKNIAYEDVLNNPFSERRRWEMTIFLHDAPEYRIGENQDCGVNPHCHPGSKNSSTGRNQQQIEVWQLPLQPLPIVRKGI